MKTTSENIYKDKDIYSNLSDNELKEIYEDLESDYWINLEKEKY